MARKIYLRGGLGVEEEKYGAVHRQVAANGSNAIREDDARLAYHPIESTHRSITYLGELGLLQLRDWKKKHMRRLKRKRQKMRQRSN